MKAIKGHIKALKNLVKAVKGLLKGHIVAIQGSLMAFESTLLTSNSLNHGFSKDHVRFKGPSGSEEPPFKGHGS
jgi:hypothetical protein